MKVFRQLILSLSLLLFPGILIAQKDVTTFGFVFKPIFPSKYFRTGPIDFSANNVDFRITQKSGISMGGVVRKGITKTLSIETGINYVKRNYDLVITDSVFTGKSDFKIVGYEIPLQALVFIQLSKDVWMNVALGPSIDLYPTDIETFSFYFKQVSNRTHNYRVLHTGLIANIGCF